MQMEIHYNEVKCKTQFLGSASPCPRAAGPRCGWHRCGLCPPLREVLLGGAGLDWGLHVNRGFCLICFLPSPWSRKPGLS